VAANASPRGRVIEMKDRVAERDALDGLVLAVRAGESRSLVVRGDPGVGKTVLLDYVQMAGHSRRYLATSVRKYRFGTAPVGEPPPDRRSDRRLGELRVRHLL
jgi:hypothetical protein